MQELLFYHHMDHRSIQTFVHVQMNKYLMIMNYFFVLLVILE